MFTSDLAHSLYAQSLKIKSFFLEDVYVGMMAAELKSNFTHLNRHYCWKPEPCKQAFEHGIKTTYFFYLKNLQHFYKGWDDINKYVETIF